MLLDILIISKSKSKMKQEIFFIVNDLVKSNVIKRITNIGADGKVKVVISNAGTKSAKQRGLQWKWYTEVSQAGIGGKHEDTKEGVHLLSKWRWGIPIFIRDNPFFADLFSAWKDKHVLDEEAMLWFVDNQVHTEKFTTSQSAEFLTDFQRHYSQLIELTDPAYKGLLK